MHVAEPSFDVTQWPPFAQIPVTSYIWHGDDNNVFKVTETDGSVSFNFQCIQLS